MIRANFFPLIGWSGLLCGLYYTFFSGAYRREFRAVIAGSIRNARENGEDGVFVHLRRNTHRVEKGLLFSPRRATFALDYIGDTVSLFAKAIVSDIRNCREDELQWSANVLRLYFDAVQPVPIVQAARERFEALRFAPEIDNKAPYAKEAGLVPLSYDDFLKMMAYRKSVRRFLDQPVPRELIDKAVAAAALAPSSCNRQPFRYLFFDDRALVRRMAHLPHGSVGFADNIPMVGALVGDLSAYQYERDRHGIYVDGALTTMAFLLALETLGLSSCPSNWPDITSLEKRACRALALQAHERIVIFLAIGYADPKGLVAHSQRKGLDQLRGYNETASS